MGDEGFFFVYLSVAIVPAGRFFRVIQGFFIGSSRALFAYLSIGSGRRSFGFCLADGPLPYA